MDLTHRFRDCACPDSPHPNGDTVTYAPRLSFDTSARVIGSIFNSGSGHEPNITNAFAIYLHEAPVAWNLLDEGGKAVPLNAEALDALPFPDQYDIADYADSLYRDDLLTPLLKRRSEPSGTTPTTGSSKPRSRR